MAFTKKTWGTYKWDEGKTLEENIAAAKAAKALIETADMQRIEDGIAEKAAKGDTGARGPEGPAGIGVKSIALTVDADGKVTSGTMTKTDNSTAAITITTAE